MHSSRVAQLLAVVAGIATTIQSRVNGQLAVAVGSGVQAAVVSFSIGLIAVVLAAFAVRTIREGFASVLYEIALKTVPWWQLIGGSIGATFVVVQSSVVPLLGVAVFTVATVGAQTASSLLVDKVGAGPQGRIAVTSRRVVAAIVAIAAIFVAVSNRIGSPEFSVWAVVISLLVGMAVAFQHALNGHIRIKADHPMSAAVFNFLVGASALWLVFVGLYAFKILQWQPIPLSQPLLLTGGLFGLYFIATAAFVLPILGSLKFTLASVAGQLLGALGLDLVFPTAGTAISIQLLAGVVLTAIAVLIANRPARA